ncbi:MAG: hypothetical protein GX802_06835, partial [Clostridiales bacterium]|nr:hypothetical protein [Clostridiales bacterium]
MKKIFSVLLIALVLLASACTAPTDVEPSPLATDAPFVTATPEKTEVPTPTESPNPEEQQPYYYSDEFEHNDGYASLIYDVNEDGIEDTICISYQYATKGESGRQRKVVAIAYGGPREIKPSEDSIMYIRDSVLIQESFTIHSYPHPQITCIKLDDGYLFLEDTNHAGGSRLFETVNAYYFDGDIIYSLPSLHDVLADEISVEFTGEKKYELTYLPTGDKFTGIVPDYEFESEIFDKSDYGTGESAVVSVNIVTGEVKMIIGVDIGAYKYQSARLDVTFKFNTATHNYTVSKVTFKYDTRKTEEEGGGDDFCLEIYYDKGTQYIKP